MALVFKAMVFGLGLTIVGATPPPRGEGADKPIPQRRQDRLLERFGDQGIDANGDGALTREEVRAFHEEKGLPGQIDGRRMGRRGVRGHDGPMRGPGGLLGHLLQELETLESQTPPLWFTVERHRDADVDEDGALSAEEWTAFATGRRAELVDRILGMGPTADMDRDGQLSEQELAVLKDAHMARVRVQMLKRHPEMDADGDGALSDAEFAAVKATHLSKLLERHPEADLNSDGAMTDEEARAFAVDRPGRHRGPHGPGDCGPGRHGRFRGGPDCPRLDEAP